MAETLASLKSAVYSVQLSLLEGIPSDSHLHAAANILTRSEYADVVTERSIVNLCGFPLCRHSLPDTPSRKGRYRISLREHKVYDLQETRLFCSADCLVASKKFAESLPIDRDLLAESRRAVELAAGLQNVTLQRPQQDVQQNENRIRGLQSNDGEGKAKETSNEMDAAPFILICEQDQVHINDFDAAGPPDAIEGYIPQREHGQMRAKEPLQEDEQPGASKKKSKDEQREITKREPSLGKARETSKRGKLKGELKGTISSQGTSDTFTSCIMQDGESLSTTAPGGTALDLQLPRKQRVRNRVSWADHNDQKLATWEDHNDQKVEEEATLFDRNKVLEEIQGDTVSETVDLLEVETQQAALKGEARNDIEVGQITQLLTNKLEPDGKRDSPNRQLVKSFKEQSFDTKNERLESAEALATALANAAEAVALGESSPAEAAARAGITILSPSQEKVRNPAVFECLQDSKGEWSATSLEDDSGSHLSLSIDFEEVDPRECWFSAPPKDFKPELSTFGTMWMALDGWVSAATIAHIYGRDSNEEDDFVFINGKEYRRQGTIGDGVTAEIERTMAGCISRALPGLVESLRLAIPIATLEQALGRFLRSMSLVEALPPFGSKQWRVVVVLFLDALSVQRLPLLRMHLLNSRTQLCKVLDSSNITDAEYEVFRDLILPLGRNPEFAAHCGG